MQIIDTPTDLIAAILELDNDIQKVVRTGWPETWLQINLPLGSTRALIAIEQLDARTPGRVADALGVSRTTVTGLLDRLESEGLITRAIDPADRRSLTLELTAKGTALIAQLEGNRREQLGRALARLGPSELQALHTGLAALTAAMQAAMPEHQS